MIQRCNADYREDLSFQGTEFFARLSKKDPGQQLMTFQVDSREFGTYDLTFILESITDRCATVTGIFTRPENTPFARSVFLLDATGTLEQKHSSSDDELPSQGLRDASNSYFNYLISGIIL